MLQVEVANVLITQCLGTFEVLQNINVKSLLRSFDAFDLPYAVDPKFVKVLGSVCLDLSPTSDVAGARQRQLKRNLAAFDLEIDEVVGDGDCAFTSIIKQLHKVVPTMTEDAQAHVRFLVCYNLKQRTPSLCVKCLLTKCLNLMENCVNLSERAILKFL